MRVPGGGASCLGMGRPGSGALPTPTARPERAGWRGPPPTGSGRGGVRAWGPVTNPTARALASWLCALWGRHEGARGGRLLPACGASGVERSRTPDCPPSGRAAGAHYPLAVGAGGCGRGDPSPTLQRALLRAVRAALGCPGGAPPAWVWGVRGRALSQPRLPALWAGYRGPLRTGCGCGGVRAWGTRHRTHSARYCELALRAVGAARGRPGGAPPARGPGLRGPALSHPRLPALWAGCRGPLPTGCGCGGARAWGPVTNPTARALASWLWALWGGHEGARGGGLLPGSGASGVGRSPTPDYPPYGRATGAYYALAVGAGGVRAWGTRY